MRIIGDVSIGRIATVRLTWGRKFTGEILGRRAQHLILRGNSTFKEISIPFSAISSIKTRKKRPADDNTLFIPY